MKKLKSNIQKWIAGRGTNDSEITIFDVKELYDAAYAEKAKARVSLVRYRKLLTAAETIDARYRAELASNQPLQIRGAA